ncbi:MAG: hypothetical protein M1839_008461 [Geoglossum umbratile]|nr:MAG: hypothetical protein M1839_008461 [Geoglossum umbratile]
MHVVARISNSSIRAGATLALHRQVHVRGLVTLAIETSCDDTCVAILEKHDAESTASSSVVPEHQAALHFHEKVTADNIRFRGIHPEIAHDSHQANLALLVAAALKRIPLSSGHVDGAAGKIAVQAGARRPARKKLDFISVTRGPGMWGCLTTGLDTAKGLAAAFQVPLVAVNHMQAHALTPRLVSALRGKRGESTVPGFPFMSLLVSGGHTMLVYSKSLNDHEILASTVDIAIGDFLDKAARDVVPRAELDEGGDIMFGRLLENFVFPDGVSGHNYVAPAARVPDVSRLEGRWERAFAPPMLREGRRASMKFSFTGLGTALKNHLQSPAKDISLRDRIDIGQDAMRAAFEHLASRVIMALESLSAGVGPLAPVSTLVVSGGVASNKFLRTVLRSCLDVKGYPHIQLVFPPQDLCTDNAAMIAWAGLEMFEAGWESELSCKAKRKWPIDPSVDGGILGVPGWKNRFI